MIVSLRSRWQWFLVFLLVLLAGSLLLRHLALWQYDHVLNQRALHDLSLHVQGQTPLHWDFSGSKRLANERNHLGDYLWIDGELHFTSSGRDPYFYLPLVTEGIHRHYKQLVFEMHASQPSHMQLFHKLHGVEGSIHGSHWLDVPAGWKHFDIELDRQYWHVLDEKTGVSQGQGAWAGGTGVVSGLRLDPVNQAGIEVRIRNVRLLANPAWQLPDLRQPLSLTRDLSSAADQAVVALNAYEAEQIRPWLQAHQDKLLLLADATPWRTPESAYRFRQWVLTQVPQAIWFPAVPNEAVLQTLRELPASKAVLPDARWHWPDWRWPLAVSALLAGVLYTGILLGRVRFAGDRVVAVLAALLMPAAVWIQAGQLSTASGVLATGSLGLAVLFWLWRQPGVWWQRLGLQKPTWVAWRETLWLSLPAAAVLAWMALSAEETVRAVSYRDLLMYPLWVVIQQLFLSVWLTSLLAWSVDLPQRRAWLPIIGVLAGFVFALLHFPNYGAMAVVYLMGTGWACLWLRHRSLWPLMVSHAVLGLAFSLLMPGWLRLDGNVGAAYFAWLW